MSRLSWAKIAHREVLSEGVKKDPTVGFFRPLPEPACQALWSGVGQDAIKYVSWHMLCSWYSKLSINPISAHSRLGIDAGMPKI